MTNDDEEREKPGRKTKRMCKTEREEEAGERDENPFRESRTNIGGKKET